jgi:hypothetical protein
MFNTSEPALRHHHCRWESAELKGWNALLLSLVHQPVTFTA